MNEELAREAAGLLGTAAATLIEAAHPLFVAPPATKGDCSTVARVLRQLASNLTALAGAAEVLARTSSDVTDRL